MTTLVQRFSIRAFFRWHRLWIGAYWDRRARVLFVCPLPMIGLRIAIPYRREFRPMTIDEDEITLPSGRWDGAR